MTPDIAPMHFAAWSTHYVDGAVFMWRVAEPAPAASQALLGQAGVSDR